MASRDKIDQVWVLEDLKREQQGAVELVREWVKELSAASQASRIASAGLTGENNLATLADNTKKTAKATDELALSMKEYQKAVSQVATLQARINTLESENAKVLASLKAEQNERNKQLKIEAQLQAAASGSIEEARANVKKLTAERNQLNLSTEEGKSRQKVLNDEIDKHNAFIKINVDAYAQQKINIGNYSGALTVLQSELTTVRQKMDDYAKAGNQNAAVIASMAREEQLLTKIVESQANGFASATLELRNNEKALQALGEAGLQNTKFYKDLLDETAELKDKISDLKGEIKNLSKDTSTLDGLIEGAQLLAGSYGIASATAELFGISQEKVEEAQKKLQAILVILNGLQALQNALQKESSFLLLVSSTRTKVATGAQWLYNYAVKAGTTELKIFRSALIATGLGLFIVALIEFEQYMERVAEETTGAAKALEKFNKQLKVQKEYYENMADGYKKQSDVIIAQMEAEGATSEAIRRQKEDDAEAEIEARKKTFDLTTVNLNRYAETEKKVRNKSKSLTKEELAAYLDAQKMRDEASAAYHDAEDKRDVLLYNNKKAREEEQLRLTLALRDAQSGGLDETKRALQLAQAAGASDAKLAALKKKINQDELADLRTQYAAVKGDAEKKLELEKQIKDKIAEGRAIDLEYGRKHLQQTQDLSNEEIAAKIRVTIAISEMNKVQLEDQKNTAGDIIQNEKASLEERLAAQSDFLNAELRLNTIERQAALKDIETNLSKIAGIEAKAADKRTLEDKKLLVQKGAFEAERNKIIADYATKQNGILSASQRAVLDIIRANLDSEVQYREDATEKIATNLNLQEQAEIQALQTRNLKGKAYEDEYNKIVAKYAGERNQQTLDYLQDQLNALSKQGVDVKALEDRINQLRLDSAQNYADKRLQLEQDTANGIKKLQSDILDATVQAIGLISQKQQKFFDDRQKQIEDEQTATKNSVDHDYQVKKSAIDNEILSDKDRAGKLAEIEQDKQDRIYAAEQAAAAQKAELDRRKQAIDKRKFEIEQAAALARVIINTTEEAAKVEALAATYTAAVQPELAALALGQLPFIYGSGAVAAGLIAAQVIAYGDGTPKSGHKGGDALIAERGEPELVKEPGKSPYWLTEPTYKKNLAVGTHVTPLHDIVAAGSGMLTPQLINNLMYQQSGFNSIAMERKLDKINSSIENMPVPSLNIDNGSIRKSVKRGNSVQHYIQRNIID